MVTQRKARQEDSRNTLYSGTVYRGKGDVQLGCDVQTETTGKGMGVTKEGTNEGDNRGK